MIFLFILGCLSAKENLKVQESVLLVDKPSQFCALGDDWKPCLDQKVKINARVPTMIMSHPVLVQPALKDEESPAPKKVGVQNYIQVGESQMVALSASRLECGGAFQVEGTLKFIDMGGPEGTKLSYANYYLTDSKFICE